MKGTVQKSITFWGVEDGLRISFLLGPSKSDFCHLISTVDFSLCQPCVLVFKVGLVEGSKLEKFFVKAKEINEIS